MDTITEYPSTVAIDSPITTTKRSIESITRQRGQFASMKTAHLSSYLERERKRVASPSLVVLNGWSDRCRANPTDQIPPQLLHNLLKENNESLIRCGGYWMQLGGVGVVINPGRWFLERFHAAGLHIWDIDHVIVTDGKGAAFHDLERIWTFNKEINTLLKEWQLEPHVISYWLHATAFEQNAHIIRPIFRQEKASVHRLGTFHDISAFETVELNEHLSFDYSATSPTSFIQSPLMLRFRPVELNTQSTVGFHSQAPWHESQNTFFSDCQTMILGVGDSSFEEITNQTVSTTTLGTTGVINILNNSTAQLALIAEQGLSEGDIRIESIKYVREEIQNRNVTILPVEEGVTIDLNSLHMTAKGLETPTPIESIRSMRSTGSFSPLAFLDESSIL